MNILAIIQARGGSKGIPKKNIYPINGYPLISYTIAAAKKSNLISDIVVSTDSKEIADTAVSYGALVPFMRPPELAGDKVLSVDSLYHAAVETEKQLSKIYDYIIELPCVSPLRDHHDIDGALNLLINSDSDSIISMVPTGEKHPIRLKKIIDNKIYDFTNEYPEPGQNSRRQDLFPLSYIRNGAIYAMTRKTLIENKSRHGVDSLAYIMEESKSVNIDTIEDLEIAEYKIKNGYCNNNPSEIKESSIELSLKKDARIILVTTALHFIPSIKSDLREKYSCIFAPAAKKEQIRDILKDYNIEGWICSPTPKYKIDNDLIALSEKLKIIVTPSTGSNHIIKSDCKALGVEVKSLKGTNFVNKIYASSEFCFALIMAVVRNLPQSFEGAMSYKWREAEDLYRGVEFNGKTIGVIGYGRIGANVARYSAAMNMKVCAYDPYIKIEAPTQQLDSYQEVLRVSDIILIAVHLDDNTKDMIDKSWFDQMKFGVYFINISRGEIVNEVALIEALSSGRVKSAGLDVIRDELAEDVKSSPVINYAKNSNNLIITPHIAGLTIDSEYKAAEYSVAALNDFMSKN
jgi:D-3-phosphoglycerate dehydrogenase / 2-oxoglutarate reductase